MNEVSKALKLQREAQRRRALAPEYDPVRRDFDLGLANEMEQEAQALLVPTQPLQNGLGGEIVPPAELGLAGLESVLKEPDLLNLSASEQRAQLLERNGVLELGIEAAHDAKANGSIQKMVSHQLAAGHKRAMELLAQSAQSKDPDVAIKMARASARLMDAFSRSALTLQRLQGSGGQTIQVQYVQVNGQAMVGQVGGEGKNMQNMEYADTHQVRKNIGGRPPTTGDRTQKAIAQRRADRELMLKMQTIQAIE
jgi:hypothetical protein